MPSFMAGGSRRSGASARPTKGKWRNKMAAPWWEHPRRPPAQKSMDRFAVLWMKAYATCCDLSETARIWMADARADGWRIDGKLYLQEPLSRACTMTREDLRAICICRNEPPILRHLPAGCITLWKGAAEIPAPLVYDWPTIKRFRAEAGV